MLQYGTKAGCSRQKLGLESIEWEQKVIRGGEFTGAMVLKALTFRLDEESRGSPK